MLSLLILGLVSSWAGTSGLSDQDWEVDLILFTRDFTTVYRSGTLDDLAQFYTDDLDFYGPRGKTALPFVKKETPERGPMLNKFGLIFNNLLMVCENQAVFGFESLFQRYDGWRIGHGLASVIRGSNGLLKLTSVTWANHDTEPLNAN